MIAKAIARFIRVSPTKARLVANIIKGRNPNEALAILANVNKQAKVYIAEVIKSALANAKRKDARLDDSSLYISKITVDGGPFLARYRAASMGRAVMIRHRTSHITVELDVKPGKEEMAKESKKEMKVQVIKPQPKRRLIRK